MITGASEADHPILERIWEGAVRATHDFLAEADIAEIRSELGRYFQAVELLAYRGADGAILGFAGLDGCKVEMLFVAPEARGKGVGSALLRYAVERHGARELDVNEQNAQALGFYLRMGFRVTGRSATDSSGRPFPLLHMELER